MDMDMDLIMEMFMGVFDGGFDEAMGLNFAFMNFGAGQARGRPRARRRHGRFGKWRERIRAKNVRRRGAVGAFPGGLAEMMAMEEEMAFQEEEELMARSCRCIPRRPRGDDGDGGGDGVPRGGGTHGAASDGRRLSWRPWRGVKEEREKEEQRL